MTALTHVIAPSFYDLHCEIKDDLYTHYFLKGGRGSTKSTFISIEIVLGIMKYPNTHAVVLRKVAANLKDSVYEQLLWAIDALGVGEYWKAKLSPLELVYIPTGQRIIFRGADKPRKIKSIKVKKGYIRYIWFEELDEFYGMEELRVILQSLMRGGHKFDVFYSFNPPKARSSWVNGEVQLTRSDRYVHHSTYLEVPKEWLGEQFVIEAEHLKQIKPEAYDHEYGGEVTGTGGEIFPNVQIRPIPDEEIAQFEVIRRGMDFGYSIDPFAYNTMHYDRKHKRLYLFFEIYKAGLSNRSAYEQIEKENKNNEMVTADSSEPKSINEMRQYGIRIRPAKKGPDSVNFGIKFLQSLEAIVIDDIRCPETAREFTNYELEKDANGNFKVDYPDKNNHAIDAVRYGLNDECMKFKEEQQNKPERNKHEDRIQSFTKLSRR